MSFCRFLLHTCDLTRLYPFPLSLPSKTIHTELAVSVISIKRAFAEGFRAKCAKYLKKEFFLFEKRVLDYSLIKCDSFSVMKTPSEKPFWAKEENFSDAELSLYYVLRNSGDGHRTAIDTILGERLMKRFVQS